MRNATLQRRVLNEHSRLSALRRNRVVAAAVEILERRCLMATVTNGLGDTFTQQWQDDFVNQSSLNTSRWKATNDYNDAVEITPTFSNGLQLTVDTTTGATPRVQMVETRAATLFGRYEMSFTSTASPGLVQASFLHNRDYQLYGNLWNEIDMELYGLGGGMSKPSDSFVWGGAIFQPGRAAEHLNMYQDSSTVILDGTTHTWTIDWTPSYVLWSVDGTPKYAAYNRSTQPGWIYTTETTGNAYAEHGVEAMVLPQNWALLNNAGGAPQAGLNHMTVQRATAYTLNMQTFNAKPFDSVNNPNGYNGISGFVSGADAVGRWMDRVNSTPGAYIRYNNVAATWRNIAVDVANNASATSLYVRSGSPTGPIIATIPVPNTSSWTKYALATATLPARTQADDLYLTMPGNVDGRIYNVHFYGAQPMSAEIPFGDIPRTLPGRIAASDYDAGGAAVAYNTYNIWNDATGAAYRTDAANLAVSTDTDGGLQLVNIHAGNWYRYAVNVPIPGAYTASFRINAGGTGSFHLEDNAGNNLTGPINVTSTGWAYTTLNATVNLPAGQQILKLVQDTTGGYNLHWMEFTAVKAPFAVSGRVQSADYNTGGSGNAYSVYSVWNDSAGATYRTDAANLAASTDTDGGLQLVNIHAGNWYKYAINPANTGTYTASFRVNAGASGSFHLEDNAGNNLTGPINVTSTSWAYTTLTATIKLAAGAQLVKLVQDTTGGFNIHWMEFTIVNYVNNPSFETGNLTGWSEWVPSGNGNANANYKDSYGGGHSGTYHLTHYATSPYSIQTLQTITGLADGTYSLSAWVKSSGGFSSAYMYAWRYNNPSGGSFQSVNLPTSTSDWVLITIPNIIVTSGMVELGFYTNDTVGNKWAYIDDVVLTKVA